MRMRELPEDDFGPPAHDLAITEDGLDICRTYNRWEWRASYRVGRHPWNLFPSELKEEYRLDEWQTVLQRTQAERQAALHARSILMNVPVWNPWDDERIPAPPYMGTPCEQSVGS